MAFKMTKTQIEQIADIAGKIRQKTDELEGEVGNINTQITNMIETNITPLVGQYNDLLSEARELIDTIASDMRGEFDDKSETWQEGERGQTVSDFIQQFEDLDLQEIDTPTFEELTIDLDDEASNIEALPEEP